MSRTSRAVLPLAVSIVVLLALGVSALAAQDGPATPEPSSASAPEPDGPSERDAAEQEAANEHAVAASEDADTGGEATQPSGAPTSGLPMDRVPVAADDPAGLAEQITLAERTIRSEGHSAKEVAAAGHLQQVAYRQLTRNFEWRDAVLARVPAQFHGSVRAHTDAARGLTELHQPRDELPAWRIVPPAPPDELLSYYREAQQAFGVPWEYLAAINLIETRMGRIEGTSVAGAQGPMQFMPATWDTYGRGDINDDRDAILAAGRYLAASGAPADMAGALFSYNRSQHYVRAVTMHAKQMQADPRMFQAYYHWEVYYVTTAGDTLLPIGYDGTR